MRLFHFTLALTMALALAGCNRGGASAEAKAAAAHPPGRARGCHRPQAVVGRDRAGHHRLDPARAARRPARRGVGRRAAGAEGKRRRRSRGRPAGAPGRHRDPRQPGLGAGSGSAPPPRPSSRPSASSQRLKTLRASGMVSAQAAGGRRDPPQQRAERPVGGQGPRGAGAPAAAAHRGARALRRRGERPQGLRRRHRADRQGAAQGDRPAQHALRGPGVGRPHRRGAGRAGGAASASTATATRSSPGKVRRVNPAANATTRQVEVLVDFAGEAPARLAGLYAEGRVETSERAPRW